MRGIDDLVNRYRVSENPLKTERRVELALVIVACVLLLQVIYGILGAGRVAEIAPVAPAPDAIAPVAGESPVIPSLEQSSAIEQRPLFWATRRPVSETGSNVTKKKVVPVKPAAKQAKELKNVQLVAVFAQGDQGMAIVIVKGKRHRLSVGDEIEDWTVESVDANSVSIRNGADVQQLGLKRQGIAGQLAAGGSGIETGIEPEVELDPQSAAEAKARQEADNSLSFGGG